MPAPQFATPSAPSIAPPLREPNWSRISIGHAEVDRLSCDQARNAILHHVQSGGQPAYIITPNAQHVVLLERDKRLREIYHHADMIVPDGVSLLWAARLMGCSFPERVSGIDLFETLCQIAPDYGLRVFLLGGRPGSAERSASELKRRRPDLNVSTYCPPLGFEENVEEQNKAIQLLRAARPHLLFVGLGAPKQETWIYDHARKLNIPVSMGVGGIFEMVAGITPRAPLWIRSLGFEWLYRFCLEPRRLWRRYLIGNFTFIWIVLRQVARKLTSASRPLSHSLHL